MRALITGISGQDGYYLSEYLARTKGYEVFGLDPYRVVPKPPEDWYELIEGDLTDPHSLYRALEKIRPDEVYNLGALSCRRGVKHRP